jgi:hypothetical protein
MKDFTLTVYRKLLQSLQSEGYQFITFEDYCNQIRPEKFIILRHDVDLKAGNSLVTARIEAELNIRSSYYFRVIPQSKQPHVIMGIVSLGHEIGYHYEDMSFFNGDPALSIEHFNEKLSYFRNFYPVKTICMHGSPTSLFDNRDLWKSFNYRDFGIIGEPYFDVDYNEVFYITDTGRCWDGGKYSVRDKVKSNFTHSFHSSHDIINAVQNKNFPDQVMITTHPQRWTDNFVEWTVELTAQNIKNLIKRYILSKRKNK